MSRVPRVLLVLLATGLLAAAGTISTIAYIGQAQIQVNLSSSSGVARCDRSVTITATVVSAKSGKKIANQVVNWSIARSQSSRDSLSDSRTTTNRRGRTSVSLSFGPVAGARIVTASAGGTSPSVTVRCAGGLPQTSTLPPDGAPTASVPALLVPSASDPAAAARLGGLRIERLGIDLPIVQGDGVDVPDGAAAHYPGTAWPGEGSNTYLYAHAREGHFLELWQARTGDRIEVDLADGSVAEYRVDRIIPMVAWDALEYLAPTSAEQLTLQTCLTYEATAPRFVVIASRVPTA